jgi:hypothetical protein
MTSKDEFIFTHYTDIAEAKHQEVRRLKAEATREVLRDMIKGLSGSLRRSPIDTQSSGWDQV